MQDAMNETTHEQMQKVALTRAVCAEMRDLWLLQQMLLYPRIKQINRLADNRRLTAGIDFLEIRAELEGAISSTPTINPPASENRLLETGAECAYWANWWRAYLAAGTQHSAEKAAEIRLQMINDWDSAIKMAKSSPSSSRSKRPRKRRPNSRRTATGGHSSGDSSVGESSSGESLP
jgi:hypothetical protein